MQEQCQKCGEYFDTTDMWRSFHGKWYCNGCKKNRLNIVKCPDCGAENEGDDTNGRYCNFCSYIRNNNLQESISKPKLEMQETQPITEPLKSFLEDFYHKDIQMNIPTEGTSFEFELEGNFAGGIEEHKRSIKSYVSDALSELCINEKTVRKIIQILSNISQGKEYMLGKMLFPQNTSDKDKEQYVDTIIKDTTAIYGSLNGIKDSVKTLTNVLTKYNKLYSTSLNVSIKDNIPFIATEKENVSPNRFVNMALELYTKVHKNIVTQEYCNKYSVFCDHIRDGEYLERKIEDATKIQNAIAKIIDKMKNAGKNKIKVLFSNKIEDKIECQNFTEVLNTCQKQDNYRSYATSVADLFANANTFVALFKDGDELIARTIVRRFYHENTPDIIYWMPDRLFVVGKIASSRYDLYKAFLTKWYSIKPQSHKILLTQHSKHESASNGTVYGNYTSSELKTISVAASDIVKPTSSYIMQESFIQKARQLNYRVGYYHDSGSKTVIWRDVGLVDIVHSSFLRII